MKKLCKLTSLLLIFSILAGCVGESPTETTGPQSTETQTLQGPVLELLGSANMVIPAGTLYEEPGWKATTSDGKSLDYLVVTQGEIEPFVPGTYTVTYSVKDPTTKLEATLERRVTVEQVVQGDTVTDKIIYLTFDDGPGPNTQMILDLCEKYNIKVTFFCIGKKDLSMVPEIVAAGHTVGMHSYSHDENTVYASEDAFFSDMAAFEGLLAAYGVQTKYIRFPFGSGNTSRSSFNPGIMTRLTKAVQSKGYRYFDWDVAASDSSENTTSEAVFGALLAGLYSVQKSSNVVLLHENLDHSAQAVEKFVVWALVNGYTFLPISDTTPDCHQILNN